jgi:hypothetical protein
MECGDVVTALGPAERAGSGERVAVKPSLTVTIQTHLRALLSARLRKRVSVVLRTFPIFYPYTLSDP